MRESGRSDHLYSVGWRLARVLAAAAVVSLVAAACGTDRSGSLQDFPGTTRQQIVEERVNAAVIPVQADYTATLSLPTLGYNQSNINSLVNGVVAQAAQGQISADLKTVLDTFVKDIAAAPDSYFIAQDPAQTVAVQAGFQCTGSIVTPDGYIVTAAHCTDVAADERQAQYLAAGLPPILNAAVQQFQASNFKDASGKVVFDADQQKVLTDTVTAWLTAHEQITGEARALTATLTGTQGGTGASGTGAQKLPVEIVTQGNAPPKSTGPFGDKDVSILKLNGYPDLPTIGVASDADVESGQPVYVDGYPALANAGNNTTTTPTVTAGSISSKSTSDKGVPLLGTSATVSFGNSGGPALNDSGQMVGVVSYGATQASFNFMIGGSVVLEFLHEKNILPRESTTTHLYDVALNDFHRQYYQRAVQEFQQVKGIDPSHPYVDGIIQRTEEAIHQGRDQTPLLDGTALVLAVVGAIVLVLVIIAVAVGIVLMIRRSRRRGPTLAPAGAGPVAGWPGPTGSAPPAWQAQPPPAQAAPQGWSPSPGPAQAPPPPPQAAPQGWSPSPGPAQAQPPPPPPQAAPAAPSMDVAWRWDGERWVAVEIPPQQPPR
jgi:serine protease Do